MDKPFEDQIDLQRRMLNGAVPLSRSEFHMVTSCLRCGRGLGPLVIRIQGHDSQLLADAVYLCACDMVGAIG